MQHSYLVVDTELLEVLGVITRVPIIKIALKYAILCIKEHYSYEKVTVDNYEDRRETHGCILLKATCLTEDGDKDIRDIKLTKTVIYHERA